MTEFSVPEALRQDRDSAEFVMPEALAEYHARETVEADE